MLDIRVCWSLSHMGIQGNEKADHLADLEARSPYLPILQAAESTITGLRSDAQIKYHLTKIE